MGLFAEDAEPGAKYVLAKVDLFERFGKIALLTDRETESVCYVVH